MPRLDENRLRRPEFLEGVPIPLADGQTWHFPRPTIDVVPEVRADGAVKLASRPSFGPGYDDLIDAFHQASTPAEQLRALFTLAIDLLSRNYNLEPGHYPQLLRFRGGDRECETTWQQIVDVALGRGPKACPVGGGPTCSPTGSPAA